MVFTGKMQTQLNPNLTNISTFSYKDILVRKLVRAVALNIFSQLLILILYVLISNISIFHPLQWLTSCINIFTHFSVWLFVVIFSTIIFAQCLICAKDYVLMSTYSSTRFQQLVHIFSFHNFTLLTLHVLVGGGLVWQILSLAENDTRNLIVACDDAYCLNNEVFFLLLGGLFTGFYYFIKIYVTSKHLIFPVIQQRKFLHLRASIYPLFTESAKLSFPPTLYYCLFYLIWGSQLELQFADFFSVKLLEIKSSILVYAYTFSFSILFFFTMNLMRFFFYLFLTEAVQFPLIKENRCILTLQEAIVMSNLPIVQNLACLDLFLLSQHCPVRRQFFFTLSQPGGHPHNWNALAENLLLLFNDYSETLQRSVEGGPARPLIEVFEPTCLLSPTVSRFAALRNMSAYGMDDLNVVDVSHTMPERLSKGSFRRRIDDGIRRSVHFVRVVTGINYFFGELPHVNVQKCLGNGQLIIWASQGVSELATASLKEDKFGIVQKDLPVLITTLVQLKQNLDKLNKISNLARRVSTTDDFNCKMKNAVAAAVKRSLFNICLHFGEYFKDFQLNRDVLQYLQVNIMLKNYN